MLHGVISRWGASCSFVMADICATFLEPLCPLIHTSLRQNSFSILCTKTSINISIRYTLWQQKMNCRTHFLLCANHKWGSYCFSHRSQNWTRLTCSKLHSIEWKGSNLIRNELIRQYWQQKFDIIRVQIMSDSPLNFALEMKKFLIVLVAVTSFVQDIGSWITHFLSLYLEVDVMY